MLNSVTQTLAQTGRSVFSHRLVLALCAVVVGALLIRPEPLAPWAAALSIALIAAGLGLRAWAAGCAGGHTRSTVIEAPALITSGPYAHVRNPIYVGSILAGFGMAGLTGDPWMLPLCAVAFVILYATIVPAEERFLGEAFGDKYEAYARAVPRLIPRLTPWAGRLQTPFRWRCVLRESSTAGILIGVAIILRLGVWLRA